MNAAADPIADLSTALDQTGRVIAAVRPDQLTLPTPCRSWDVATLIQHLLNDLEQFTVRARGGEPDWQAAGTAARDDSAAAFAEGAGALLETWRRGGSLEGSITLPGMGEVPARFPVDQQIAEMAVHAWDLARASGQSTELNPDIARTALEWATQALHPAFRGDERSGKAFGPEVPVGSSAPIYDRLAGFFGRTPG